MLRPFYKLTSLTLLAIVLVSGACHHESKKTSPTLDFEAFAPIYNHYIAKWLETQESITEKEIARVNNELNSAEGPTKTGLELHAKTLQRDQTKWKFRLSLGDYLKVGKPSDVPQNLVWEDGMDQPEIGDPVSKKGGAFRKYIETFPPTIRPFGENSNNSFRGDLYDNIDTPLVTLHPQTMAIIPGLAREWATSEDGRTIYFHINPEAHYSNGIPVRARDFLVDVYLRISDNVINPYAKQYFREEFAQIATYDDYTLSVSLAEPKLYSAVIAGSLTPSESGFYAGYGPDYKDRYQWRFPPTTGAYEVKPEDIIKGVSITQTRVKNWWAKDQKYYKYRFNPDKIVNTVVRDESKAFELFRAGELDTYLITKPELWYEKSEIDPVYNGYIERVTFYNQYPKVPRGLYLNTSKAPLNDRNVRVGIEYAMNWQKVIDVMFRGDYQRLNAFNAGYVTFSDPSITARPFSINSARASFAKAGYTQEGRDGILTKPDGTRLSVSVTYPAMAQFDRIFAILREEAKACGFELRLDGCEATVAYKKEMQKQHEMAFSSWLITPPVPDFYQFLYSTNAFDEKGNPRPQTNNIFVWGRPDTDVLCEKVRTASTAEELKDAAWKLQHIMHDEGMFVPGYSVDFVRVGSWRWIRWPDCETTHFSPPVVYDPHDSYVFWVDEKMKAETQKARRTGQVFPESNRIIDNYREKPALTTESEPAENP